VEKIRSPVWSTAAGYADAGEVASPLTSSFLPPPPSPVWAIRGLCWYRKKMSKPCKTRPKKREEYATIRCWKANPLSWRTCALVRSICFRAQVARDNVRIVGNYRKELAIDIRSP